MNFILSEPLHLVIQGEGELLGKKMILMRVMGCNVQCPDCDSFHTWDKTRLSDYKEKFSIVDLTDQILKLSNQYNIEYLLITGGEPQLYINQILELYNSLKGKMKFEIETTGMMDWIDDLKNNVNIHFDLSPKIGSLFPKNIISEYKIFSKKHPINFNLKFVVSENNFKKNILNIENFLEKYNVDKNKVYLMPLGTTREEMVKSSSFILEKSIELGYNFSPRLHIFIYDNKRLV